MFDERASSCARGVEGSKEVDVEKRLDLFRREVQRGLVVRFAGVGYNAVQSAGFCDDLVDRGRDGCLFRYIGGYGEELVWIALGELCEFIAGLANVD